MFQHFLQHCKYNLCKPVNEKLQQIYFTWEYVHLYCIHKNILSCLLDHNIKSNRNEMFEKKPHV